MIGVSLGWNCYAATIGTEIGIRQRKEDGYKTCPFDLCGTNYIGVCQCIRDDFAEFLNHEHLTLVEGDIPGDMQIYHRYYRFLFNHESPGHADLYLREKWEGGKEHFTSNNFEKFKERYARRIDNFRNYLNSGEKVVFLISRIQQDMSELESILKEKYPMLDYAIVKINPLLKNPLPFIKQHYEIMRLTEEEIQNECAGA